MEFNSPDRRRSPRVETTQQVIIGRPVSMTVQMLDLSANGLLLACPSPQRPGARLRVTAQIAGRRLDADFDVRHVSSKWDQQIKGYRIGGRFVTLDPSSRNLINDVLGGSGS